ncbi:MAG: oxidoreductase [Acidobacteria bacterium]|nr:oxidoreductase [Acidobacteriota bacterium]
MKRVALHPLPWIVRCTFLCVTLAAPFGYAADLRLGIIGTDSSHSVEFTRLLNDADSKDHVSGASIVAAFRGGNPSLPLSRDRIERFTAQLKTQWKIPFVASIGDLCSRVDGLLILSVDPAARLDEFKQAAACHKPVFVDKPLAGTLADAQQISQYATVNHIPWFSASALRFPSHALASNIVSAYIWGPGTLGKLDEGYGLDLAWYGIHSIEMLYAAMGPGITEVARIHTHDSDTITAVWRDGRAGTVHLVRPSAPFSAVFQLASGKLSDVETFPIDYRPQVQAIVDFVRTGTPPVSAAATLEEFVVMQAAQTSMERNGVLVEVAVPPTAR